jgi:glycosyltransferase 2 family protein
LHRWLANALKLGVSIALVAYLLAEARHDDGLAALWQQPKDWTFLSAAVVVALAAVVSTFVRWHILAQALDLRFSLRDAMRLGFIGYLFNFVSLGSVGGDLFKAVFAAREQPGRRTVAVASVVVDRVVGLFGLFLLAAAAALMTGEVASPVREVRLMAWGVVVATACGTMGAALFLRTGDNRPIERFLCRLRYSGHLWRHLFEALALYRARRGALVAALVLTLATHSCWVVSVYCVARGLPGEVPSLAAHSVIVPLSLATGVLPLPLGALGAFEGVMRFLYVAIPGGAAVTASQGLIVAIGYRAVTIAVALVGVGYWLVCRREYVPESEPERSLAATR